MRFKIAAGEDNIGLKTACTIKTRTWFASLFSNILMSRFAPPRSVKATSFPSCLSKIKMLLMVITFTLMHMVHFLCMTHHQQTQNL